MRPGSSIINVSSVLGLTAALPQAAYASSKAGLIGLTRDLAQQWTPRKGIRVNALAPGYFATEMTEAFEATTSTGTSFRAPMGRLGQPNEIGAAVVYPPATPAATSPASSSPSRAASSPPDRPDPSREGMP